jgi:hypothetical protein
MMPRSNEGIAMNAPLKLRPDFREALRVERRSWSRAITARALSSPQRSAEKILARNWPHDSKAELILKGAASPSSTTNTGLPPHDIVGAFRSLAPGSAAWKLFANDAALKLDLTGVSTVSIPHVASFPPQPVFVAEGAPGPVVQWSLMKSVVGPARKIMVISAISEELESASPQSVSGVIGRVLSDATNKSIDVIAFDANAGDAVRPPGLLFGVTPITAATAGAYLQETIAKDLSNLVGAIGAAGIDPSDVVYVSGPREVSLMQNLADVDAIMSLGVPAKTVIAVAVSGVASGYRGPVEIDISRESVLHFEASSPGEIVSTPGVSATPSKSLFQSGLIAVRVRANAAWAAAPGAVAYTTGVNW